MTRIGFGYDIHRLVPDRRLILGGVEIPFHWGLLGHSDADVVLHAIGDALLGALALGDLGSHFPDTDPQFAGASSSDLLQHIAALMIQKKFAINNIDLTLIAQAPKLAAYRDLMRENIAKALGTEHWRQELQLKRQQKYFAIEGTQFPDRQETRRTIHCGFG